MKDSALLLPLALAGFLRSIIPAAASHIPIVVNTWSGPFTSATDAAFAIIASPANGTALDAVQAGCTNCQELRCDGTVGWGGSPDERCETTLDALLMDGTTMAAGAVAGLRRIRDAVGVARAVLDRTSHTLLVGDQATEFAVENGFIEEDLSGQESLAQCREWRRSRCQPNFRRNVLPRPSGSCGPYLPDESWVRSHVSTVDYPNYLGHDTIAQVALARDGTMAAATSTNGASHAVPGRVGDAPIPGAGAFVDGEVGGCGATGDGDVLVRFSACYQAVENLRAGMDPSHAAEAALKRVMRRYPAVKAGLVVLDRHGRHGGAGAGWDFSYSYRSEGMSGSEIVKVKPLAPLGDVLRVQG